MAEKIPGFEVGPKPLKHAPSSRGLAQLLNETKLRMPKKGAMGRSLFEKRLSIIRAVRRGRISEPELLELDQVKAVFNKGARDKLREYMGWRNTGMLGRYIARRLLHAKALRGMLTERDLERSKGHTNEEERKALRRYLRVEPWESGEEIPF